MFMYPNNSSVYSRAPGVKRGHHRVSAVRVLPATAVHGGPGLLFFPDETAPPL